MASEDVEELAARRARELAERLGDASAGEDPLANQEVTGGAAETPWVVLRSRSSPRE